MGKRNASFIHKDFSEVNYSPFYFKNYLEQENGVKRGNTEPVNGNTLIVDEIKEQLAKNPEEREAPGREVEVIEEKPGKKRGHGTAVVLLLIIICFSFTFLALDFLSGGFFLKEFDNTLFVSKTYVEEGKFYAVYSGIYANLNNAEAVVPLEQSKGGAGYVLKRENRYLMLLAIYENKADAESVIKKQKDAGGNAALLELEFPPVSTAKMSEGKKKATEAALGVPVTIYKKLYALSAAYSGKTKDAALAESLRGIKNELLSKKEAYIKETKNKGGADTNILTLFDSMMGIADNIEYGENLVAELRYAYCAIIILRMNFVA